MKDWETTYDGRTIRVENRWNSEKLFVDNELQDERIGMKAESRLYGRIKNHHNEVEMIKVSIGSYWGFSMACRIFINDQLIFSSDQ